LHVFEEHQHHLSWWKLTFRDRVKILFGANIRLCVLGVFHPPVSIEVDPDKMKEIA
jgi:hypothetical protein